MPSFLNDILGQLRNIWAQLSGGQRATMVSVLLAALVGLASLLYYASRPDYVAFDGSSEGVERRSVLSALDEAGVRYRVANSVIEVDSSQRGLAEAALDKKGLRGDGATEDATSGFTRDRAQRAHALQLRKVRRVEAQLRQISDVRSAMVTVYEPEGPQLLRKGEPRSASVVLTLGRSSSFHGVAENARSIVSSSLGISADRVHVSDSIGRTMGENSPSSLAWSPHFALEMQTSNALTQRAREVLESFFPGKIQVAVKAEYDNKIVQSRKSIVSENKVVVGETSYKTKDSTEGRASGDPNGVGSTTSSAATGGAGGGKSSSVDQVDKRYQPIIGEESTRALAPDLKRLSVSLAIDESLAGKSAEIVQQVKNTIGWVEGRDAEVAAIQTKFEEFESLPEAGGTLDLVKQWAPLVGQILSVLLVVFFLKGLLKRNKIALPSAEAAASAGGKAGVDDEEEDAVKSLVDLRKQIESVVSEDPASVSRLLESWLSQKEPA